MKNKAKAESTAGERRRVLEADIKTFLKAGNKIQYVESGVSAQDPQGKGRQLRLGPPKDTTASK